MKLVPVVEPKKEMVVAKIIPKIMKLAFRLSWKTDLTENFVNGERNP